MALEFCLKCRPPSSPEAPASKAPPAEDGQSAVLSELEQQKAYMRQKVQQRQQGQQVAAKMQQQAPMVCSSPSDCMCTYCTCNALFYSACPTLKTSVLQSLCNADLCCFSFCSKGFPMRHGTGAYASVPLCKTRLCRLVSAAPARLPSAACRRVQHSMSLLSMQSSRCLAPRAPQALAGASVGRGLAAGAGAMMLAEAEGKDEGRLLTVLSLCHQKAFGPS